MLGWDRFVAVWASVNLLWVAFDITYVPLRTFWLQRNLYPIPSVPLVVPLSFIPDLTPLVDPIKGIEPHRETQTYLEQFRQLDAALLSLPAGQAPQPRQVLLLNRQAQLTAQLIDSNPFLASEASGTLEKIKNRLRQRADRDSARQASSLLLSSERIQTSGWSQERLFWNDQVLPLVATNYWRSIDENGRPTDHFWRIDLLLFQSVFVLDILLRLILLRRRLPGLSWGDALLRRWSDLPLLLPFWRWLRLVPVLERLQTSGLVNFEPLRAVVSRGVVALLAVELFEVLSLVRIWAPLLLSRVAPKLAPELQGLLGYSLRQSLERTVVPAPLRQLQPLLQVETGISRQLASGMVDSLLELSRSTGNQLSRRDDVQLDLLQRFIDRFWEELAAALESGSALERSQELLCTLIDGAKGTYLSQINRAGIEALIQELDQLMTAPGPASPEDPATPAP